MVEFGYRGVLFKRPKLEHAVEEAAEAAFAFCGRETFEIAVLITGKCAIRRLNRRLRGIDRSTDVLSFPASDDFLGETSFFGDIAISLNAAKIQARRLKQSLIQEMEFLTVHGCLHLCGYDHKTKTEEKKMREAQRAVLGR